MNKYKVGDLVKIVKPFIDEKENYKNEIRRIKEVQDCGWYRLENTSPWRWHEDELELLDEIPYENEILEKKEGNKMIESLNLIDVYAVKMVEKLEKEYEERKAQLQENNEVAKKYEEILAEAKSKIEELHMSQFTKEEKEQLLKGMPIGNKKTLIVFEEILVHTDGAYIQDETEEQAKLKKEYEEKVTELKELIKTVKAHVGIAKTKEEVEDILIKYDILNKKGMLVVK